MKNYSRPLYNNQLAFDFLTRVLGQKNSLEVGDNVQRIVTAEKLLQSTTAEPTMTVQNNRHPYYATDESRKLLREKIFTELAFGIRLDNDDNIKLGEGGALPKNEIKKEGKAFIIIGLPASGKSTIASKIADYYNAAIIDSDYAKRKFPEYSLPQGASVVHDESTLITFGAESGDSDEPSLYEYFTKDRCNIVIPKIGHDEQSVLGLRDALLSSEAGSYSEVHLVLVSVDRTISTNRALNRFISTNRYVPLSLVFDVYANDPTLTYYRIRDCENWASTGKMKTEQSSPVYVSGSDNNPVKIIFGGQDD
ncbi:zeta toxin family protein [Photobacterium piscicola]|uniref:Zeta toxin family protein n=1 Tax=Photobacterium piscicola TaxID=1378299 RepID=A0ABU6LM92_9GAMM|nr:zeta toxin family protein [Photobacterium piscicola]